MSADEKPEDRPAFPALDLTPFTGANQRAIAAMAHVGTDAMQHVIEMNVQFLDFVRGRLGEDAKVAEALASCQSSNEAIDAVNGFYQRALEQYAEEMRVLSDKAAQTVTDTMKLAEDEFKRTADVKSAAA
jgi:hypothetical protein